MKFILSVALFLEYEDVIKRKSFLNDVGLRIKDADAIVTFNTKDFADAAHKFDVKVMLPKKYLLMLRSHK